MIRQVSGALVGCALLSAAPAFAQDGKAWPGRTFVSIDVPFQPLKNDFSESLSFTDSVVKTEKDAFNAGYASARGPLFDVGAGIRLAGDFGFGATGSWFRRSGDATFGLAVPNPSIVNKARQLSGTVTGLNRRESAVHLQALYAVGLGPKARVMLSGGPTVFNIEQDLVKSIEFDEGSGFSSIRLNQVIATKVSDTVVGFNVGADVVWPLASHFAVGSVTRYSRANFTLDPGASTTGVSRAVKLHAGGLQIGAGIRLLF